MKIRLSDHFTSRRLLRFALPSILMMVFTSIYGVVDGYFISNYVGKTPFAAVNFIMPFLMLALSGAGASGIPLWVLGYLLTGIYVLFGVLLTVDLAAEAKRLRKELEKAEKDLSSVSRTLSNEGFVAKAAPAVIEKKRAQQAELTTTIEQLKGQIADFE